MINLDGSIGEGGGSILRVGAGLATALNQPLFIQKIRAHRKKPGLKLQHVVGLQALCAFSRGHTTPFTVGTENLEFYPGKDWTPDISVQIETAGNIGLFCQTLQTAFGLPIPNHPLFTCDILGGASYGLYAPGTSYIQNVTFQHFHEIGYSLNLDVSQHGFFPKGGAKARLTIHPQEQRNRYREFLKPEHDEFSHISGIIHVDRRLAKPRVGERIVQAILSNLESSVSKDRIEFDLQYHSCLSAGVAIDAWVDFEPSGRLGMPTMLGKREISSEQLGKHVAYLLHRLITSPATVDNYAADQILPVFMLLEIAFEFKVETITPHLQTNIDIVSQILHRTPRIQPVSDGFVLSSL